MNSEISTTTENDEIPTVRFFVNESSEVDELMTERTSWRARPYELAQITSGLELKRRLNSGQVLEGLFDGSIPRKYSYLK